MRGLQLLWYKVTTLVCSEELRQATESDTTAPLQQGRPGCFHGTSQENSQQSRRLHHALGCNCKHLSDRFRLVLYLALVLLTATLLPRRKRLLVPATGAGHLILG
ncbi:hypothetical protein WJX82_000957 [Trebouxia sp. C0006]